MFGRAPAVGEDGDFATAGLFQRVGQHRQVLEAVLVVDGLRHGPHQAVAPGQGRVAVGARLVERGVGASDQAFGTVTLAQLGEADAEGPNATALLGAENVDGLLVGGASLDALAWATICEA